MFGPQKAVMKTASTCATGRYMLVHPPPLSFPSLIFLFYQGKTLKLTKDLCPLPNPLKLWKNQRKRTNNQKKNPCLKLTKEIQKPRKGRTGPCTKCSFSLEVFILGLKFAFSIENFDFGACFSVAREGHGMKKSFSIENFIPY